MSQPFVQVLVDFDMTDLTGNPFQLDNATYGILDTSELAEADLVDVTYLVKSVSVDRGRSRQLDQFNAGSATVVFDNSTRVLDPLNEDSIYFPNVLPRCAVQIKANGTAIFTGLVVDWNLSYDITGQDIMVAVCSDDFTVLANQVLDAFTPAIETSGDRILDVLARPEIEYLGPKQISSGSRELGDYAVDVGTNVLNYLQLIAKSEQGSLYTAANGVLTFKGVDDTPTIDPARLFSDDGDGIPYQTLLNQFGDELLYNYIITESPAGGPFVASDLTSQTRYQYQQLVLTDLLNSSSGIVESIGVQLLNKYKNPLLRWTGLTTQLVGQDIVNQNICLQIDLTDLVQVTKTFQTGTPSSVRQIASVSGINHQIVPSSHTISFTFEPLLVLVVGADSDVIAGGYRTITWKESGSINVIGGSLLIEYLVVAGGGGGGTSAGTNSAAGGGGAGGLRTNVGGATIAITGDLVVTVGAGGAGGANGSASSIGSLVSTVGGGRGGNQSSEAGIAGGSGGGGASGTASASVAGGAGTSGEGSAGGTGQSLVGGRSAGGGGGAGAVGADAVGDEGGDGGAGVANTISGTSVTYAGGGGGGSASLNADAGVGGAGGGGAGSGNESPNTPTNGTDGLGGGGGGAGRLAVASASGGDGVVIVRWVA